MELNEKLHQLRKKNGFTQAELAEKLNVSRQSVSNWELGTITPSVGRLKALSQLYNVPWESLLSNEMESTVEKNPKEETVSEESNDDSEKKISENPPSNRKRRIRVIVLLLIAILVIAAVIFAVYSGKEEKKVQLSEMTDGEIAISSGNSFDLEF